VAFDVGMKATVVGAGIFHAVAVEFAFVFSKSLADAIVGLCHVYLPSIPQRGDEA
jgi:hypothetical protein